MESWQHLALALALGLLIGTERGWHEREAAEGQRIAGVRTFGLIGLLGAIWALLAGEFGAELLGFAFLGFVALVIAAYLHRIGAPAQERDYGATTAVAALLTFGLGAMVMRGHMAMATTVAVVTATLLGMKPVLHHAVERLERRELFAVFKLLLISVVLLPVLPDRGFGPWHALNPYELWWLVVLIAGLSFVGYFAVKLAGTRRGIGLTALFGGLASSTATTLNFARLGRHNTAAQVLLAAGVLAAAATMFPRMLIEVAAVNHALLPRLLPPLAAMAAAGYGAGLWLWWGAERQQRPPVLTLSNPFELGTALKFGALLALVVLLSKAFQIWFGDLGLYLLAAVAGLGDVDAITLSMSRLAGHGLDPTVAMRAVVIAALVNTAVKGVLVAALCGGVMARRVILAIAVVIACGGAVLLFA